eukprot:CAMPEP_0196721814 /NCGR_PEP_ID=MMETSP1091-20130531/4294_1 /TAXON_ID=302021 /ORGANISM="Rhodomonas sp., Strain CCMP768" /LENGTH=35 /DNA_ID= /DNA_START= /DNA_END= /DNA_ORIENTATION=
MALPGRGCHGQASVTERNGLDEDHLLVALPQRSLV